ncbi:hypothetical protein [Asticcacaulis sp. AC402]|uniref:hypothetical protein n=1 Tax=Asticcacaulis sp. AC402 TaxID=1282361 RepID=UPI0003C40B4C|nr:hypothetical protein [Asticcacaulis sp. AC402]ESQ75238.1 hypothetical protein ABAC402_10345 [Asticcacaulis sp. AC402]
MPTDGLHHAWTWLSTGAAKAWHGFLTHPATPMLMLELALVAVVLAVAAIFTLVSRLGKGIAGRSVLEKITRGLAKADLDFAISHTDWLDIPPRWRWLWLCLIFGTIAVLATYLPLAMSLIILVFGLLFAHIVYRVWTYNEDDRAQGLTGEDRRIPMNYDMNHEVWLCAVSVVIYMTLIFHQVDVVYRGQAFAMPGHYGREGYFVYVLEHLLRSLPIVGNLFILDNRFASDIRPVNRAADLAIFAIRTIGDIVVVLVIVKMAQISLRKRFIANLDRQEARLLRGKPDAAIDALGDLADFVAQHDRRDADRLKAIELLSLAADPPLGHTFTTRVGSYAATRLFHLSAGAPTLAREMLQTAENGWRRAAAEYGMSDAPDQRASVLRSLGDCLSNIADYLDDDEAAPRLRDAAQAYRQALLEYGEDGDSVQRVQTHYSLGYVLLELSHCLEAPEDLQTLHQAEMAFEAALTVFKGEKPSRRTWTCIRFKLGVVAFEISRRIDGPERLARLHTAEVALRDSLSSTKRSVEPLDWAAAQGYLGLVLTDLGAALDTDAGLQKLHEAEDCLRNALLVYTRKDHPAVWVSAHRDLINVRILLGERLPGQAGVKKLEDAVQACQTVLQTLTPQATPEPWADMQEKLGDILCILSRRLSGSEGQQRLEAAAEAFRQALLIFTAEDEPEGHARVQASLAAVVALMADHQRLLP